MNHCNLILTAIAVVLGWELPDDVLADAVKARVGLMAGFRSE